MMIHVKNKVDRFYNSPTIKVTFEYPDPICNANLSSICKDCLEFNDEYISQILSEDKEYRQFQIERMRLNKDYKKIWQISREINEVAYLLFYGIEPKIYTPEFILNKINSTGEKIRDHTGKSSLIGFYVRRIWEKTESLSKQFPLIGRLME